MKSESVSCSVVSDSLQSHELYLARLHFLFQGSFWTQGLNTGFLHYRQILCHLSHQGSTISHRIILKWSKLCDYISLLWFHNQIPQTGWLKEYKLISLHFQRLKLQGPVVHRISSILRPLFLACKWLPSPCVLVWSPISSVVCTLISSSYRDTILLD